MYRILCDNVTLHDDRLESLKVFNPKLELEVNKTGSFTFTIYPNNSNYSVIKRLKSIVTIYQEDEIVYRGRVLNDEIGFHDEKHVSCEGDMAFLLDSIRRPYTFTGTVENFVRQAISSHNGQVDAARRFTVGNITVTGNITIEEIEYKDTLKTLNESLVDVLGGYIRTRHENGVNYIDYLSDFNVLSNQTITFAKNLLDMKRIQKGEDIATALLPLGAKLKDSEGKETNERLTIKSVNNNIDFIQNQEAVTTYGYILKTEIFDDITEASALLIKGQSRLNELVNISASIELSAADLSSAGYNVNGFRIGRYIRVKSEPHGIDENFLISKLSINLLRPESNSLTLGKTFKSFTEATTRIKGQKGDQGIDGAAGENGVSVSSIIEEFYLSTSKEIQTGGTWTTVQPNWTYGRYLWTRSKITYSNNTTSFTVPVVSSEWEAVNYLEIGGRNLFENSAKITVSDIGTSQGAYNIQVETEQFLNGCNIISAKYNALPTTGGIYLRGTLANYISKMIIDETYTVSVWAKCSVNINRGIMNAEFLRDATKTVPNLSTEWQLYTTTGIYNGNTTERIAITFYYGSDIPIGETIYITSPKVEFGNKATDWTPAPEDIATEIAIPISNLEQNFESAITQSENEIILKVAEDYYLKDETNSLVSSVSTELTNTKNSVDIQFNTFNANLEALQNGSDAEFEEIRKYIRFIDGKILLGEVGNELELEIQNDRISFLQNNAEVTYFSNNKLYVTDGEYQHSLKIGQFAFVPRENGNLSFNKVTAASSNSIVGLAAVGTAVSR